MPGKRRVDIQPQLKKRRKTVSTIEEIKFDVSAREEYLTGFHKRKLQRVKHAKEEALKKERVEKIEARRIVRLSIFLGSSLLLNTMGSYGRGEKRI